LREIPDSVSVRQVPFADRGVAFGKLTQQLNISASAMSATASAFARCRQYRHAVIAAAARSMAS